MRRSVWISATFLAVLVVLGVYGISSVWATVQTDKEDYAPGSTVTISGDNSNGAGYLAGETVDVAVTGPNGYEASCSALVDVDGAWTCQIILWDDDRAIGSYQYVATGRDSGVSEPGTFTDARNWSLTFAGTGGGSVTISVSAGTINAPTSCGGTGAAATSQTVNSTCSPNITTSDNNAVVTFNATAAAGSTFGGWSGQANLTASPAPGCTGTNNPCRVIIGANGALTVSFNALATSTPSVTPTPTRTATSTVTPTATNSATNTATRTPTPTPTNTATFTPSFTATATPTNTSTPSPTPTNVAPIADAGGPYSGNEGESISLDGSASEDPDGSITSYEWDLDDDGGYDDALGEFTSVTFPDDGTFAVGLRVTDSNGATHTDSAEVTVNNLDPVIVDVDATPSTVDEGTGSVITVDATDVAADVPDLLYSFDCENDGTYDLVDQTDNFAGCSFPDGPATVTVGVRVDDQDGGVATSSVDVTVTNLDPVIVDVDATPSTVDEGTGSVITVNATDVAADVPDLLYSFDCENDGTYDFTDQTDNSANCSFPDGPATVTVGVRVDDQDGGVATSSVDVTVVNLDPVIADVDATPSTVDEGSGSVITVDATDVAADVPDLLYSFDCENDGTYDFVDQTDNFAGCSFPDGPATVTVGVRVDDQDGGVATSSVDVTVTNLDPVIADVDATPSTVDEGTGSVITVDATDVAADVPDLLYSFDCENDGTYDFVDQTDNFAGCSFPDGPATVTVGVRVDDQDGGVATSSVDVTVVNLNPVIVDVDATPSTVDEGTGSVITVDATDVAADVPDLLYSFDCENDGTYDFVDQTDNFAGCSFPDGPATVTVGVRVDDQDGGVATSSVDVTVTNLDPVIADVDATPSTVDEGSGSVITVDATDVPADVPDLLYSFDCENDGTYDFVDQTDNFAGCSFPDGPATVTVGVRVDDQDGGVATSSVDVTVNNVAPTVVVSGDFGDVDEGEQRTYTYTVSDPGEDTPVVTEDCGTAAVLVDTPAANSFDCVFTDGPASTTINVTADDGDPSNNIGDDPNPVNILNVEATVTAAPVGGEEGASVSEDASFSDPGVLDTHTCSIDWGDGNTTSGIVTEADGSGTCAGSHTYDDDGTFTVTVTVTDNDGDSGFGSDTATTTNVAPTATLGNDGPVDEGSPAVASFTAASDPSAADTSAGFRYAFACDNGSLDASTYANSGTEASASCTYEDNGTYSVRARIIDKDDGYTEYSTVVTVNNVAPTVTAGAVAGDEGASVSESASFTDPGVLDTHECSINWGDGNTTAGSVVEASGSGTCTGSHTYADNGGYTVTVTVTDNDGDDASNTAAATIANVKPTVSAGSDQSVTWVSGGAAVTLAGPPAFSDPGADTHTCTVAWGDGGPTSAGTVAETVGNPTTGSCAASHNYALPGVYTVTVTVCDDESACGNDVLLVSVGLAFHGFLQPLNDPAVSTNTPSVWKKGSNVPLKFQLRDAGGVPIPDSLALAIVAACPSEGARVSIAKLPPGGAPPVWATETETSSSPTADGGTCFRYDASADQFIYNLGTKTPFYAVLPHTFKASATVTYNGGVIASHTQANTFGLK